MNREPLTKAHGAPLRIVVPGIIGARSVKWIERIIIRDKEVRRPLFLLLPDDEADARAPTERLFLPAA